MEKRMKIKKGKQYKNLSNASKVISGIQIHAYNNEMRPDFSFENKNLTNVATKESMPYIHRPTHIYIY